MVWFILLLLFLFCIKFTAGVNVGEHCDPKTNHSWSASPVAHQFLYCHHSKREYAIAQCSFEHGQQKVFDAQKQQCVISQRTALAKSSSDNSFHLFDRTMKNLANSYNIVRETGTKPPIVQLTEASLPQDFGTANPFVIPPLIRLKQASSKNTSGLQQLPFNHAKRQRNMRPILTASTKIKNWPFGSVTEVGNFVGQSNNESKFRRRKTSYGLCPGNRKPMLTPSSRNMVNCSLSSLKRSKDGQMDDDCQHRDFRCTFSTIEDKFGVCCQRLDYISVTCPQSTRPMTVDDEGTHKLKECSPSIIGACHSKNAVCVFDLGDYHCCQDAYMTSTDTDEGYVETSVVIYMKNTSNKTLTTLKDKPKGPQFIKNRPRKVEKIEKHSAEEENKCPGNQQPFKDPHNELSVFECNLTKAEGCPPGFHCHTNAIVNKGLCCGITNVCDTNSGALIDPSTNQIIGCNSQEGCPEPFYCNTLTSTCCSMDPVSGLCNHGISLLDQYAKAVECTEQNRCPQEFSCLHRFNFSLCCPTKENICSQPLNTGLQCLASHPQTAFYFNKNLSKCKAFIYTGCSGNQRSDNRFEDEQQCMEMCHDIQACENGDPPFKDSSGLVRLCSIHAEVEYEDDEETLEFETPPYCPQQHKCEFNSGLRRFQCCPDVTPISLKENNHSVFENI